MTPTKDQIDKYSRKTRNWNRQCDVTEYRWVIVKPDPEHIYSPTLDGIVLNHNWSSTQIQEIRGWHATPKEALNRARAVYPESSWIYGMTFEADDPEYDDSWFSDMSMASISADGSHYSGDSYIHCTDAQIMTALKYITNYLQKGE